MPIAIQQALEGFRSYIDTHDPTERPILSVYVNTNPADPQNQRERPAWLIDLKNAYRDLVEDMDPEPLRRRKSQAMWAETEERIIAALTEEKRTGRGVVIFTDHTDDLILDVPVEVPTRLYYGLPQIKHLLYLFDQYRKYLVALTSDTEIRFVEVLLSRSGEATTYDVDPDRLQALGRKTNTFAKDRRDLTYERRNTRAFAEALTEAYRACEDCERIVLAGNAKSAHAIRAALSPQVADAVIGIQPIPFEAAPSDIGTAVREIAEAYEVEQDEKVVDRVISSSQSGGAALFGVDAVKGAMSEGRVRELVLPHPIDAEIFDALVVDAARRSTPVEFVTGPAAEKLEQEGGLGAVLHYAA